MLQYVFIVKNNFEGIDAVYRDIPLDFECEKIVTRTQTFQCSEGNDLKFIIQNYISKLKNFCADLLSNISQRFFNNEEQDRLEFLKL